MGNICNTCAGNRVNIPVCECEEGFYDILENNCVKGRQSCTIPNDHILHIDDAQNFGAIPANGKATQNSAYLFPYGVDAYMQFPAIQVTYL